MTTVRRWPFRAPPRTATHERREPAAFSVVIAARNAAGTIREAIESVLAQTIAPTELIVSDDGSTDAIGKALRPYSHRLRYLRSAVPRGVAAARNAALAV